MQVNLRIPPTKVFFFQTSKMFLPPFYQNHVVFQYPPEAYIGENEIIVMIEVIVIYEFKECYYVLKELHQRKYENCIFSSLQIFILKILTLKILISPNTKELCKNYLSSKLMF